MTPEQYEAWTAKLETLAARQEAISARIEVLNVMLTVGIILGVMILIIGVVTLILKVVIYRRVTDLLDVTKDEASAAHNLLRGAKEYTEMNEPKKEESRNKLVEQVRTAVGEEVRSVVAETGLSSDQLPKPIIPTE